MLTVTISDQLGNQMFAYASVKTIAQNRSDPSALFGQKII